MSAKGIAETIQNDWLALSEQGAWADTQAELRAAQLDVFKAIKQVLKIKKPQRETVSLDFNLSMAVVELESLAERGETGEIELPSGKKMLVVPL